jgi:hypothetical protein
MTIPARVAATLLVLVALALRLPPALHPDPPQSDAADYQRLALGLRNGRGYVDQAGNPTAFRPPLYPAFLALLGGSAQVAAPVQALLGVANVLLLVALGLRLLGSGPAPWIAGALVALDPVHAEASSRLLSETLYGSLLLLVLLALHLGAGMRGIIVAGACCGLGALTRSAGIPLIAIVCAWLAWRHPRRWWAAGAFVAAAALTVSPWILRNSLVLGAPVLTTQGGITLYSSYRPPEGRILGILVQDDAVRRAQARGEVEADRQLTVAAFRLAVSRPAETLRLALLKIAFFWVPIDWEVRQPPGLLDPIFLFALPLAAWGAVRERRLLLPCCVLAGLTVFSAAVYGSPRLRLPYEPLVALLAAVPLAAAWRHPLVWGWAALCAGLGLAGGLAHAWLRSAATVLGLWR